MVDGFLATKIKMKFVGVIPSLEKYKQHTTLDVKDKNGVTRPITKVYYTKPCLACGMPMEIDLYKKGKRTPTKYGIITKGRIVRWKCTSCSYCEREETEREELIRQGEI